MTNLFKQPALVVVDVQRSFDDADYWGVRDNPECEANIGRLITCGASLAGRWCSSSTIPPIRARHFIRIPQDMSSRTW